MRVVVDINVLVSAVLTPAPGQQAREIFDRAESDYTLLVTPFMLEKLSDVLAYDRIRRAFPNLTPERVQIYLDKLGVVSEIIEERTTITEQDGGSRDPEDNRILAGVVDGNATHLVTRNTRHFPKTFKGVAVISPAGFLQLLRESAAGV